MDLTQTDITARVRAQYEEYPYPDYSLLIPLRTQEAYASHSLFAARILEQYGQKPIVRLNQQAQVLLAGCGDIYPYMASFWEPRRHHLLAVDLSQTNLQRARLRSLPRLRSIAWQQGNLEDPQFKLPSGLSHIDSYGVLHHMANPSLVLQRFERHLLPGGTARIMVYNSAARHWIHQIQKAFGLLGFSAFNRHDLDQAQRMLERLARLSPPLKDRLAPMRDSIFKHSSRFVDTFFHAREARLDLRFWLKAIEGSGLNIIGLFDRYAELDDLSNPLLDVPSAQDLDDRVGDRRFENNFEFYLAKLAPRSHSMITTRRLPGSPMLKSPPQSWFAYEETSSIPWLARRKLWLHFLRGICAQSFESIDPWAARLKPETLQRLARIGAIFPDDFHSRELQDLIRRPIHNRMEAPDFAAAGPIRSDRELQAEITRILIDKKQPQTHREAILNRFEAAQKP